MAVAFIPLYINYLGVEAYGLIGLFAVIQAMVMILDMGMGPTLNREMARFTNGDCSPQAISDLLRSLEIICYSLAIVVVVLIWLFSDYLAREWLRAESLPAGVVANALALMALVAALRLIEGIYRGSLYGMEQQIWYNFSYSFLSTLRYVGALVILEWLSATIEAFFIWQAVVSCLTVLILSTRVHQSLPKPPTTAKFSQEALSRVWKFAGGVMGITLLTMLFLQLDKVLLSRWVTLKELGYYSLAVAAANVMFMVVVPITQAVYPHLVKLSLPGGQAKMADIYHTTTQLVTVLTASASMLLYYFSGGIIFMWSGNQDLVINTAPILSVLAIGSFLNGLSYLPYQLQIAHGWTSLLLKMNIIIVITFILMLVVIVPIYGVIGAAWVWVILNAIYLIITSHFMHRKLLPGHQWRWYLFDILLPACGAGIVMMVAIFLQPSGYANRLNWFIFLLIAGIALMLVSALFASSIRDRMYRLIGVGNSK